MAELWNYVVLEGCTPADAGKRVSEALAERGWRPLVEEAPGARHVSVWPSTKGLTVIDLEDWEEHDPDLARALSRTHPGPVVVSFFDGAGETEAFLTFASGKKARAPDGALGEAAARDASPPLAAREPAVTLAFLPPVDAVTAQVLEAIRRHFAPLLAPLALRPRKAEVRYHPGIDAVIAYGRELGDAALRVRFDYPKGSLSDLGCTVVVRRGTEEKQWGEKRGRGMFQNRWLDHPEFFERDMRQLAGELTRQLSDAAAWCPSLAPLVEAASRSEAWQRARAELDALKATERIGEVVDSGWRAAKQIFRGAKLLTVEPGPGERFTFRLDTSLLPASGEIAIGDVVALRSGARFARALKVGDTIARFDELGTFLKIER